LIYRLVNSRAAT